MKEKVMKSLRKLFFDDEIVIRYLENEIPVNGVLQGKNVFVNVMDAEYLDMIVRNIEENGGEVMCKGQIEGISKLQEEYSLIFIRKCRWNRKVDITEIEKDLKNIYFSIQAFAKFCIQFSLKGSIVSVLVTEAEDEYPTEMWENMIGGIAKILGLHRIRVNGIITSKETINQSNDTITFLLSDYSSHITGVCLQNGR